MTFNFAAYEHEIWTYNLTGYNPLRLLLSLFWEVDDGVIFQAEIATLYK